MNKQTKSLQKYPMKINKMCHGEQQPHQLQSAGKCRQRGSQEDEQPTSGSGGATGRYRPWDTILWYVCVCAYVCIKTCPNMPKRIPGTSPTFPHSLIHCYIHCTFTSSLSLSSGTIWFHFPRYIFSKILYCFENSHCHPLYFH